MGTSLSRQLLEAHALPRSRSAGGSNGWTLQVDHFVFDPAAAALVFRVLGSLGAEPRAELLLTCVDPGSGGLGREGAEEVRLLADLARRRGAHVSRSGSGGCDPVHRERYASPGKLLISAGQGVYSPGALGMLCVFVSGLEAAFVLAGGALYRERFPVLGVRLRGGLASWVGGTDLALEVGRRLDARGPRDGVVEFFGPGVASLAMTDRLAAASQREAFGELPVVFPTDPVTRRYLKAQGREADWKALEAADEATYDHTIEIDLDIIEPMIAPREDPGAARSARHAMGMGVRQVLAGPGATVTDLARFAGALAGRAASSGTTVTVVPGSRQVVETAERLGVLPALVAAGVRVLEAEGLAGPRAGLGTVGAVLGFGGIPEGWASPGAPWYVAGPEVCAAAAASGRITDPRELGAEFVRDPEPAAYVVDDGWILRPLAEAAAAPPPDGRPFPSVRRLEGPLRGPVLLKIGDHVTTEHILPWGARMEPMIADIERLAENAFAPLDPGFAGRARRCGGGFVVAGLEFGAGARREQASLIPGSLGVRAVLARSFDPRFRIQLVHAGVLPLRLRLETDYRGIAAGDELEIPGLPDSLDPGKPLEVRNLTRGTQHTLPHDLGPREADIVRAGGLLGLSRPGSTAAVGS